MYILISFLISVLMIVIVFLVSFLISSLGFYNREKSSSFECGFDAMIFSRIPFSFRFFLLTIIFLVFDVEVVLFIPMCMSFMIGSMFTVFISNLFFIIILLMGLFNEWLEGSLDWV
uniref:NADH-ubiquinone oxidoreductase chain 3 n=1 Tax=Pleuropoma jana TaxID=1882665 RepID=A0A1B2G3A6_9GAST|nr:NADH dehydrogenase subunit 3 [Pleuropoma jana]